MTEAGLLSIVRRGTTYQVRYASSNPSVRDEPPYACPDERTLVAVLQDYGLDPWTIQQAGTELRHGRMAVLALVSALAQRPPSVPSPRPITSSRVPAAAV